MSVDLINSFTKTDIVNTYLYNCAQYHKSVKHLPFYNIFTIFIVYQYPLTK